MFVFPILSHLLLLTLVFRILFSALVLFLAYKYLDTDMSNYRFTILISKGTMYCFTTLEQILPYMESVRSRYYIKVYLLMLTNVFTN